jgi:hypothetical protein
MLRRPTTSERKYRAVVAQSRKTIQVLSDVVDQLSAYVDELCEASDELEKGEDEHGGR